MKSILNILLATYFLTLSLQANTDSFKIIKLQPGKYELKGRFDQSSYPKIKQLINKYENKKLEFIPYSYGGSASRLFEIQDAITKHGNVKFTVKNNAFCKSTCAKVAMSAKVVKGTLHFHKISVVNRSKYSSIDFEQVERNYNSLAKKRLIKYGLTKEQALNVIKTPKHETIAIKVNKS